MIVTIGDITNHIWIWLCTKQIDHCGDETGNETATETDPVETIKDSNGFGWIRGANVADETNEIGSQQSAHRISDYK
jgi:hypothetical protein